MCCTVKATLGSSALQGAAERPVGLTLGQLNLQPTPSELPGAVEKGRWGWRREC